MRSWPPADDASMAIRWLLIVGAVVAFALVLLSFKRAHTETNRLERIVAPAHVSPAQFRRVKLGMSVARVRRLLGAPDESARASGQLCWDYGTPLSKGGMYAVCFRGGKVTYTSRVG
jgi:outer membrane protein assembly factor BamE (lipoprotein component of BamABCDE complex)